MLFGLFRRKKVYRAGKPRFHERVVGFFYRLFALTVLAAIVLVVGGAAWLFYSFLFRSDYFAVRTIELANTGLERQVERQTRATLDRMRVRGRNLLLLDTRAIAQALQALPKVRSAQVDKEYPSTVRIRVQQRRIAALVLHDPILAIDGEGVIIETLSSRHPQIADFPFISGLPVARARPGDRIRSDGLTNALLLLSCLNSGDAALLKKVSEAHCDENDHITLFLRGGTEIRFGAGNPIQKMPLLEAFVEKMGEPDRFAYIDLRFDGQIASKPKPEAAAKAALPSKPITRVPTPVATPRGPWAARTAGASVP